METDPRHVEESDQLPEEQPAPAVSDDDGDGGRDDAESGGEGDGERAPGDPQNPDPADGAD